METRAGAWLSQTDPKPQEFHIQQLEGPTPLPECHMAHLGSSKHFKLICLARNGIV